jgi:hypothetical protein
MLSHYGVVLVYLFILGDTSCSWMMVLAPPRGWMTVFEGRCSMMLLELPSDFCMMMLYYSCHWEGVFYMVLLCWMCDGHILDDWMS